MKGWQRRTVWLFTFGFGLIWVLAFLLPTEVGGGVDRHGMYAPDILGTRLYYTTGVRATSQPLTEHTRGAQIFSMDLRDTNVRTPVFSAALTRRDDYYGAKRPQVYRDDSGYHVLYMGLGYDGRNRVCMADSADGIHFTPRKEAVFDAPGPVGLEYIQLSTDREKLYYLVPRAGERALKYAIRRNGSWSPTDQEIDPADEAAAILRMMKNDSVDFTKSLDGDPVYKMFTVFPQVVGLRIKVQDGRLQILVVGGEVADGRLRTALFEGSSFIDIAIAPGSQPDGSITALGKPAQTTYFDDWAGILADFVAIVSAFGFGMGLISIIAVHGKRVRKGGEMAPYSVIVLVAVVAMLTVQLVFSSTKPESGIWYDLNQILFYHLQFPLGSTMFGLLAAYLVSAAYRAFRIRSFDAAVLAVMAGFVMLTQVPTGQFLASLFAPGLVGQGAYLDQNAVEGRTWMLSIANDAVQRGVGFGAFVGAIAMAMRIWLSLDKTSRE